MFWIPESGLPVLYMGAGARIKTFSMVMSVDNISRKEGVTQGVYFPPVKGDVRDRAQCG